MRNSRRAGKPAGKKPEKQSLLGLFTKGKNIPTTAQQTLPYREMYRDGVCRVADRYYTKTIEYEDINYQLAQSEDQAAIFDGWSACLNYFDSSLPFQLSFLNHRSRPGSRYSVNIPMQDDDYNSVRCEYVEMLENQIAKSNNGIVRTKLLTFGVNVDDLSTARARLERVEADICGNFKKLGVKCRSLSGLERLELLHGQLHPGSGSPFRFSWDMIPKTGLSTKDFIAPDSFDFRFSRLFRVGTTWGAASYLQILASELSDKLLAELLEMDAEMTITLHIQTVDQAAAVKSIKAKVSDIDKMKVEEQKNYRALFQNTAFRLAVRNTCRFLCICIPALLAVSLLCAVLLGAAKRRAVFFKSVLLLPYAIPVASIVVLWRALFSGKGLVNGLLVGLGCRPVDFMGSSAAFWVLIFTYLWRNNGYDMLLWLAGLEIIPRPLYEAAAVDGATPFQTFVFITLPNLLPTVVLTTILSLVNSFKVFREAYLVAGNYPQESIYLLQHLFNNWFLSLDIGKLSAAAVLLALGLGCVVYLLYHFWGGGQE